MRSCSAGTERLSGILVDSELSNSSHNLPQSAANYDMTNFVADVMFPEAEQFAKDFRETNLSLGIPQATANRLATDWLEAFNALYVASCENADGVADFDRRLDILRSNLTFDEKLIAMGKLNAQD
jgi:hypothetical protein